MYCPKCATPQSDGAKFCRSCGMELEAVALALSGKTAQATEMRKGVPQTAQDWMEKRIKGVKDISGGTILLAVSLLLGAALALFLPNSFDVPWILVWTVLFGWIAVWGGIELANGIGSVLEAKSRLRLMRSTVNEPESDSTPQGLLSTPEPPVTINSSAAFKPHVPVSVTEGTTRQLNDLIEK